MREACPDHDPIPDYVENTFRSYLECGILSFGFGRCFCPSCKHGFAVAYSCKTRGLCPSCNSKRMAMHPSGTRRADFFVLQDRQDCGTHH